MNTKILFQYKKDFGEYILAKLDELYMTPTQAANLLGWGIPEFISFCCGKDDNMESFRQKAIAIENGIQFSIPTFFEYIRLNQD